MIRLLLSIGKIIGLRFASDNTVLPVLRLEQYHRSKGPGYFFIIPVIERTLPAVPTGIRVGEFIFQDVLSQDNILFNLHITVLFSFDPSQAPKQVAAQFIHISGDILLKIVRDYASHAIRRMTSTISSEQMTSAVTRTSIEESLVHYLTRQLHPLGMSVIADGGIFIKDIVGPERYHQSMINARSLETTMRELVSFPNLDVMKLGALTTYLQGLVDRKGDLLFMHPFHPLLQTQETDQDYEASTGNYQQTNGHHRNGHRRLDNSPNTVQ